MEGNHTNTRTPPLVFTIPHPPQTTTQGCKNAVQIQKLEALHTRQQAVLRRKTEEAEAARKRLKEVQLMRDTSAQSKEANARAASAGAEVECQPNTSAPLLRDDKARKAWVERELDACCAVWCVGGGEGVFVLYTWCCIHGAVYMVLHSVQTCICAHYMYFYFVV